MVNELGKPILSTNADELLCCNFFIFSTMVFLHIDGSVHSISTVDDDLVEKLYNVTLPLIAARKICIPHNVHFVLTNGQKVGGRN